MVQTEGFGHIDIRPNPDCKGIEFELLHPTVITDDLLQGMHVGEDGVSLRMAQHSEAVTAPTVHVQYFPDGPGGWTPASVEAVPGADPVALVPPGREIRVRISGVPSAPGQPYNVRLAKNSTVSEIEKAWPELTTAKMKNAFPKETADHTAVIGGYAIRATAQDFNDLRIAVRSDGEPWHSSTRRDEPKRFHENTYGGFGSYDSRQTSTPRHEIITRIQRIDKDVHWRATPVCGEAQGRAQRDISGSMEVILYHEPTVHYTRPRGVGLIVNNDPEAPLEGVPLGILNRMGYHSSFYRSQPLCIAAVARLGIQAVK